jgi:hypothetical protein
MGVAPSALLEETPEMLMTLLDLAREKSDGR